MLTKIIQNTEEYISSKSKIERKIIGQFFTSVETAKYMANLFHIPEKDNISILDPGAGTGILVAALIDSIQTNENLKSIKVVCYENDPEIVPILAKSLKILEMESVIPLSYDIYEENYITSQSDDFCDSFSASIDPIKYDLVISNPPYKKISKDAPEAKSMPSVCHGAPNLYFLFASMGLFNLKNGGEMVFIIPRSWTSGAYFSAFREYFLDKGKIRSIHLFTSRSKVFEKESVLQETIIVKIAKQAYTPENVIVTTSNGNNDFHEITSIIAPYELVVSQRSNYVYLITSEAELRTLNKINQFGQTLLSLGYKMKTGLTVDFRCKDLLSDTHKIGMVPLFYPAHIQSGKVIFPLNKKNEYIQTSQSGLIQNNSNYLFVKRFTAKEEKRRLQCGIYLSNNYPEFEKISTQNKLNFIDSIDRKGLDLKTLHGFFVIFNSTLYDDYYRILNGSTQVNSTEINAMPMPTIEQIRMFGEKLILAEDFSVSTCDIILGGFFNGEVTRS